jgi:23S rRNA pseudouridine1911/1915/1917 synthase
MKPVNTPHIRLNASWPEVGILYEDSDLFVLNKPAGLPAVPERWKKSKENLAGLLQTAIQADRPWARERGLAYLIGAHRLDAAASGILIFARNRPALANLARQFRQRRPERTFTALIQSALPKDKMEVDLPVAPSLVTPGLSVVDPARGRPALTRFTLIERFRGYSLIRIEPATGHPHQIRAHLKALGCHLVADADYGTGQPLLLSRLKKDYKMKAEGERPLLDRPALHAEEMKILQPVTGIPLTLTAPWPKDLTVAVKYLRKFAPQG